MSDTIRRELLTATEVAKMLGFSRSTFYEWLKEHPEFPKSVALGGNVKKWKRKQVEAFIDLLGT
jgi:excisionase family DNA binding protein